jgi:hypothetical protein
MLTPKVNEREFREMLSKKVSGTTVGMWLLIPGLLKLGAWDILKSWTGKLDMDIEPRIALQLVNESALCVNRVRRKNSLNHQGFQLLNGMSRLVSDEQVHLLLNSHTMKDTHDMMLNLGIQRKLSGHYQGDLIAIDPHRIISSSKRVMAKKKKQPDAPSQKMLQTFFSVSAETGQPIMAAMSSSGMPTTKASLNLISTTDQIIKAPSLLIADKEHFTNELFESVANNHNLSLLTPALNSQRIKNILNTLEYTKLRAGFAIAETDFYFDGQNIKHRLIAERFGEKNYRYGGFLTSSSVDAQTLLCENYDKRWSVEEFFRFENDMGLNRASTMNLNIRYANLSMAMLAQAATYELRKNMNCDYRKWDARHLSNEVLAWNDGDIKVKDDTIIVTLYGSSDYIKKDEYINLPNKLIQSGIDPHIPWLYNYKLDFRFK